MAKKIKRAPYASAMTSEEWDILIRKMHMDISRKLHELTLYWAKELPEYLEDTHG